MKENKPLNISTTRKVLWGLGFALLLVSLYMALLFAPRERTMGDVQRIFYFHMPLAWNGFLAFFITFLYGIRYLIRRDLQDDQIAASSAEVGLFFITLALITGSLWARPAWGTFWVWEPRLTTAFILWLMYVFYLFLRRSIEDRDRVRLVTSVYGIIAFVNVPLVFMSIRWWRTQHPVLIKMGKIDMAPQMVQTLMVSLVTFTILYVLLLVERRAVERLEDRVRQMKEQIREVWQ